MIEAKRVDCAIPQDRVEPRNCIEAKPNNRYIEALQCQECLGFSPRNWIWVALLWDLSSPSSPPLPLPPPFRSPSLRFLIIPCSKVATDVTLITVRDLCCSSNDRGQREALENSRVMCILCICMCVCVCTSYLSWTIDRFKGGSSLSYRIDENYNASETIKFGIRGVFSYELK